MNEVVLLAYDDFADAMTEFTTIVSSAWTFITSNWWLIVPIAIPIVGVVVSAIIGFVRANSR